MLTLQDTSELLPGLEAEGSGTPSGPQPGILSSLLGVTAEGREASSSAGEVEVSCPAECTGRKEQAAPLLGFCSVSVGLADGPSGVTSERVADESVPPSRA